MFDLMKWLESQETGFRLVRTTDGWECVGGRGFIWGAAKELPDCIMKAFTAQGGTWQEPQEETPDAE